MPKNILPAAAVYLDKILEKKLLAIDESLVNSTLPT